MAPFYDHLLMCLAYELFYANRTLEWRTEVLRSLFSGSRHIWRIKKKKKQKKPEWFASVSPLQSSFVRVWSGGWKPAAVWTKPLKKASAIRNSQ